MMIIKVNDKCLLQFYIAPPENEQVSGECNNAKGEDVSWVLKIML